MDDYAAIAQVLPLALGVGWASGINVYAAVLMLGLAASTGAVELPPGLDLLQNPLVVAAAGTMYLLEFMADKVPGLDSAWDVLHTLVRIPGGALLAAAAMGPLDPSAGLASGALGGTLAAAMHATKTGSRMLINTSPEPLSNWAASVGEDVAVFAGLWLAFSHPWIFTGLLALLLLGVAWLLPRIWRGLRLVARKLGSWLRPGRADPASS